MAANMAAESVNLRNFSSVLLMLTEFFSRKTIQLHWIIAIAEKKYFRQIFFLQKIQNGVQNGRQISKFKHF